MGKIILCLSLWAALCCAFMGSADAMTHIVGGSLGWTYPPNKTFYEDWAKPRTFGVYDKLVFPFRSGVHGILQVNEKEFNACTQMEVIKMIHLGPAIVWLNKTGDYFFYCSVGLHCEAGEKLKVTVVDKVGSAGVAPDFSDILIPTAADTPAPALAPAHNSANSLSGFGLVVGLSSLLISFFI